jgi:hypothetical protein
MELVVAFTAISFPAPFAARGRKKPAAYTKIESQEEDASSACGDLQAELHSNMRHDLNLQVAYTAARAIDPNSGGNGSGSDLNNITNPYGDGNMTMAHLHTTVQRRIRQLRLPVADLPEHRKPSAENGSRRVAAFGYRHDAVGSASQPGRDRQQRGQRDPEFGQPP